MSAMNRFLLIAPVLAFAASTADAKPDCLRMGDQGWTAYGKYAGTVPKGFQRVCPGKAPEGSGAGEFEHHFVGAEVISGTLSFQEGEYVEGVGGGDAVRFVPSDPAYLPTGASGLQLEDHDENKRLRPPAKSPAGNACWQAPATLLVKRISVINDGSDRSGQFAAEYKVQKVGRFAACLR